MRYTDACDVDSGTSLAFSAYKYMRRLRMGYDIVSFSTRLSDLHAFKIRTKIAFYPNRKSQKVIG